MKCVSANEMLCGLGIDLGNNCKKNVCKVNAILRRHYTNLIGTEISKGAMGFSTGGEHTLTTENGEDIYKVLGILVKLCDGCKPNPCFYEVKGCDCDNWYGMSLKQAIWDLDVGCYTTDCDKIMFNVGDNVENGYVLYSRGPLEISSMDEDICIDPLEFEILQLGMMRFHAEISKDFEMASYFEQREFNSRNRLINEVEDRIPQSIGFGFTKK